MIPLPEPEIIHTVMPDDYRYGHVRGFTRSQMIAYGRACAAAERERCAKVCEELNDAGYTEMSLGGEYPDLVDVAAAIRSLKDE